jgi:hypothetical protein
VGVQGGALPSSACVAFNKIVPAFRKVAPPAASRTAARANGERAQKSAIWARSTARTWKWEIHPSNRPCGEMTLKRPFGSGSDSSENSGSRLAAERAAENFSAVASSTANQSHGSNWQGDRRLQEEVEQIYPYAA